MASGGNNMFYNPIKSIQDFLSMVKSQTKKKVLTVEIKSDVDSRLDSSKINRYFYIIVFVFLLYLVVIYKTYFVINSPFNAFVEAYTILTTFFLFSRFILSYFYTDIHERKYPRVKYPSISFVISCKNEEDSIYKTIDTCLASEYPGKMECIVVNDGSTDSTLNEMKRAKNKYKSLLTIIDFPVNRGKREGMAEGVIKSNGEIIVFVDSDSFVQKNAVKILIEHFIEDSKVGAVSGNSMVENHNSNALTRMQSARYGVSYDVFKTSESVFGTVTCCPGCFSAYRKKAILEVINRWRHQTFLGTRSTFGDDRSLTNFVLRSWKVIYCRKAVATTIVPEKYKVFFKQQLRWKKSWIREGTNAGSFIWKKNPIASLSFYTNLIIPIAGPFIVLRVFLYDSFVKGQTPLFFICGVVAMSVLFGIWYYLIYPNRHWWYVIMFTFLYTFVLVWQMPYALIKLRDTRWGTR